MIGRGIDPDKIHVITNGVDVSRFKPREKDPQLLDELGLEGKFVAGYIGTHGLAHALDTLLRAAARLRERPGGDDYRLILMGDGANKTALMAQAEAMGLDNVLFIDTVPKDQVVRYWSLLDGSVIHLKKTELFMTVIPSKLFESMGMGIPILHGVAGESAEIVEREGVGLLFEPEDDVALCDALVQLREDSQAYQAFHASGLAAAKKVARAALAARMLELLERLVSGAAREFPGVRR